VLDRAERHVYGVVGADDPGAALGLEDPDQPERDAPDMDRRAEVGVVELKVVGGRAATPPPGPFSWWRRSNEPTGSSLVDGRVGRRR
jgi:hypothetical protein